MSLRKAMRNARKSTNYDIGKPPRGYLSEEDLRRRHLEILPDAGVIQIDANDGMPRESIELQED